MNSFNKVTKILHITPHLGGGVGKVMSGVATSSRNPPEVKRTFICLEKPEKTQFLDLIVESGHDVVICPNQETVSRLISEADVVQIEWWNHPALILFLYQHDFSSVRLFIWSHVSGLNSPIIPQELITQSCRFAFTSKCSMDGEWVKQLSSEQREKLTFIPSSGGFVGIPLPSKNQTDEISIGYVGSFNFAKMHPRYVEYISAIRLDDFKVRLIGDTTNQELLEAQCEEIGKPGILEFCGYTNDIVAMLGSINVLAYLLNPEHYGTTENALLEAMAMGIVPVVMDNAVERYIVEDGVTGIVVSTPEQFSEAIVHLAENPKERIEMGVRAATSIRERFSQENTIDLLCDIYKGLMQDDKKPVSFKTVFGPTPADWFLSCQYNKELFLSDGTINAGPDDDLSYGLFEQSKGSVFHFNNYFSEDERLEKWAKNLQLLR